MSHKPGKSALRVFDHILSIGAVSAGALLVFIMLAISLDVILRYSINQPLEWAVEISQYTLVVMTFLGAAWVLKRNKHVVMDQLIMRLSPKAQAALNAFTSILSAMACCVVVWYGTKVALEQFKTGDSYYSTLEAPKWPITAIVAAGFLLLFFQFLRMTREFLAQLKSSPEQTRSKT